MQLRNLRKLAIVLLSAIPAACGTTEPVPEVPCPLRPELQQIDPEFEVSPHVQAVVVENYLRLIEYSRKLEVRANCGQAED